MTELYLNCVAQPLSGCKPHCASGQSSSLTPHRADFVEHAPQPRQQRVRQRLQRARREGAEVAARFCEVRQHAAHALALACDVLGGRLMAATARAHKAQGAASSCRNRRREMKQRRNVKAAVPLTHAREDALRQRIELCPQLRGVVSRHVRVVDRDGVLGCGSCRISVAVCQSKDGMSAVLNAAACLVAAAAEVCTLPVSDSIASWKMGGSRWQVQSSRVRT